ncbi:MAG: nucleotidyltransferase family protein [Patescibacteria group bacterium]
MELSRYKAVILAGGKGTRLYPVTKEIPKSLLPVRKKPIVNYLVDLFHSHGVKDVALSINDRFREDFDWWKRRYYPEDPIKFFVEKEPLGTFGGLWHMKDWIGESHIFLTNGDELKEVDLAQMAKFHQENQPLATIALVQVPNPQDYGVVVCDSDLIEEFVEKPKDPPTNYISSGLYIISPEILQRHPGPKFLMIEKDIFPQLAKERKAAGFKFQGKWMDAGTWERYQKALDEWGI